MTVWRIYFWEPTLSPHKLALFRALAADPRVASCTYVTQRDLTEERRAQGWAVGALDGLDIRIAPDPAEIDALVADATGPETVHLFSGIHGPPVIVAGIAAALKYRARFGLMSEPRASEGLKGLIRLAHSWASERKTRRYADFILAIGRNGPPWFYRAGYRGNRIFPFAYFLPAWSERPARVASISPVLVYLGRLTPAKGIGVLLDALALLPPQIRVEIAGHGSEAAHVSAAAAASGGRLVFHGPLAMAEVPAFLARADLLVQPSLTTDDGWGAVVSEALLAGVAPIATTKVGASILLDDPARGRVINRPEPRLLAEAVAALLDDGTLDAARRVERQNWARARLTGDAGAAHLLSILAYCYTGTPRPAPFYA